MRAAMNAILYLLGTGCPWPYLPRDSFPPVMASAIRTQTAHGLVLRFVQHAAMVNFRKGD